MTMKNHTALITGASAGIGKAFAHHLAKEKCSLLLVARREERLKELAAELVKKYNINCHIFAADLNDPSVPAAIMSYAENLGITIDILINNAGLSGKTAFAETPWPKLAAEIQLMITSVTELCHRVLPQMQKNGWGRIINLSSLAAFSPPGASLLYTGIKHYILDISQSLDMELKPQGIHVTALCPGFTHSEFHDVMGTRDAANNLPTILWQQPEQVVKEGWDAVMNGKPVCVPGLVNKVIASSVRPLPMTLQYFLGNHMNPFKQ
ncbi:short-chain dehydrogenase [Acinetobacter sp. NRRL B-65365]|uniref:SDR family NAD(P)-dependent oxidoreductase n=1 Tax=Acinetobacter sp. NRRL B-65365 TaxID=1785092 RepID=UPI00079FFB0D|nr:SDR family oxidoreductase [Acinetobacter sp. NRRL B-65365]KYQ81960.1 short-chain dehydrogenase [Acinetobacter sp. NRRL B-65365]